MSEDDTRTEREAQTDAETLGDDVGPRSYDSVESVCPSCSVGCGLRYSDRTDGAVGRDDAPVNTAGRLCPKGIRAFDSLDDNRLTAPLVREDGALVAASWGTAFDRVERGLRSAVDAHGPDAAAFLGAPRCTNEVNYLFAKAARLLGTNNVDNRARICHRSAVSATADRLGCGAMTNTLEDLSEADVFLVVGANPVSQQPIAFDSYVRPALGDGATLVHVDPRSNRTTRAADVHLAPRPGEDAALLNALLAELLASGAADREFVRERTRGFDAFADSLAAFDADAALERAGVDADAVRRVAGLVGDADRTAVLAGTGAEADDHRGTATVDALLNLLLLTGNLGKRGTGMNVLRGLSNEQGANDAGARPTTLPGFDSVGDAAARERVAAAWGVPTDRLPDSPGRSELDAVRAFGDDVRAAYVLGENPAVSRMDDQHVARRIESLDFLVVQDIAPSETVEHADVVLPGSAWAETEGTVTNLDRRVQRMRAAADPPGRARRDFRVLRTLGRRLFGPSFAPPTPAETFDELTRVNPLYAGMSYEGLADGSQRWPFPAGADEGVGVLHRDEFRTGDRRAPFVPVEDAPTVEGGDDGASDLTVLTRNRVNESGGADADPEVVVHPADARERGVDGDQTVLVEGSESIRADVTLSDDVREGTVFVGSGCADRLASGAGRPTVRVRAVDSV